MIQTATRPSITIMQVWIGALLLLLFAIQTGGANSGLAQEVQPGTFTDDDLEFFETQVRPILVEHCYDCHGPESAPIEGGLALTSREAILSGGDTGPAVVPGDPDESLLVDAVRYGEVYEMPPDSKLPDETIAVLEEWVRRGAPWSGGEAQPVAQQQSLDIAQRVAEHWCWQPRGNPVPPTVDDAAWPKESLDRFILARLEQNGLKPASDADRRTLIRRLSFDLIGLPPTAEEVERFVQDASPDAVPKLVDRLLDSPQFGERWARHWMDLTRYAETCGHEFDYPIPFAFEYRDYLIRAFNQDVPYDDLIREHIAGDLLRQPRRNPEAGFNESILGTGFWHLHEATHGPVDVRADEAGHIDNQIDVMSKTFLGLTVSCARCHDHKFDAISTEDYYALCGYLQSSRRQVAMLDPGRKIERAWEEVNQRLNEAESLRGELDQVILGVDPAQTAGAIRAAVEWLRLDPRWSEAADLRFQGESLKKLNQPPGTINVQTLQPREQFRWDGNKQLFWIDGQPGDQIDLEFEVPDGLSTDQYRLQGQFTQASDYARIQVLVDGQSIGPVWDFYDTEITNRVVDVGALPLAAGRHVLTLRIEGHDDRAAPRHVVGLDYIQLVPVYDDRVDLQEQLAEQAVRYDVAPGLVRKWAELIRSEQSKSSRHPLNWLRQAATARNQIDEAFFQRLIREAQQAQVAYDEYSNSSTLMESFDEGWPEGWVGSGFAFQGQPSTEFSFAVAPDIIPTPGVINSGTFGRKFEGVLYSPTFEIQQPQIHLRMRGERVTVRLIIDGFVMDVYNALLFNGIRVDVNTPQQFEWITLGGDLKNYLGHRAHLEIIDHGDGWFELDQVRWSDHSPVDPINSVLREFSKRHCQSIADLASAFAASVLSEGALDDPDRTEMLRQMIRLGLVDDSKFAGLLESESDDSVAERLLGLQRELAGIDDSVPKPRYAVAMIDGTPEDERVFIRGNPKTLGPIVPRRFLEALDPAKTVVSPEQGSGRLMLANQIADPDNPLTARVAVNRVWHHLMGRGIVASVDNFGVLGQRPTHPELLDYLANEFVNDGWSIKRLIRRIVLSRTYQMASAIDPAAEQADPGNRWWHRAPIRRLEGEAIRDAILRCSGRLDTQMYGPSVPIHLTPFMSGRGRPGSSGPLDGDGRRSIYIEVRRNFLSPMMLAFDTPIPFNTIGRRNVSNVPAQALILMNDPFVIQQCQVWAERLVQTADPTIQQRLTRVFESAIGRPPTEPETVAIVGFMREQARELGIPTDDASLNASPELWADVCHVVFNMKEFVFLY